MIVSTWPLCPAGQASTAALVLAAWIASRSEQSPSVLSSSVVVVTVIVAAFAARGGVAVHMTMASRMPRKGLGDMGPPARSCSLLMPGFDGPDKEPLSRADDGATQRHR